MENHKFIVNGNLGGYYDDNGHFVVCEEYGLSDADLDRYSVQVQNGGGFYNSKGRYIPYKNYDED